MSFVHFFLLCFTQPCAQHCRRQGLVLQGVTAQDRDRCCRELCAGLNSFFSLSFDCKSLGYFQIPHSQDQGYPLQSHPEDAFLLPECLPKRQQPPEQGRWQPSREIAPLPQGPPWMGSSLCGGKCSDTELQGLGHASFSRIGEASVLNLWHL